MVWGMLNKRGDTLMHFGRIICLSLILTAVAASATGPAHDFSDKTVTELLSLLESGDAGVRGDAAIFIGARYRNPHMPVMNMPEEKLPPEFPIPSRVVPALTASLKRDGDWGVRDSALFALIDLRFRTNTTPIVALALDDKDKLMRIRACSVLTEFSHHYYSEPLHARVIPTLIDCLDPKGDDEEVWQAAYAAGFLGSDGKEVAPALWKLLKHDSPKVRSYASQALANIAYATREDGFDQLSVCLLTAVAALSLGWGWWKLRRKIWRQT
jgi:HEAT repeat protein